MGDAWKDRKKAKEEEYFEQQQKQLLERLRSKKTRPPLTSPVCGKTMNREDIMGVSVDRCPESGGIWIEKADLKKLLAEAPAEEISAKGFFSRFLVALAGKED